MCYIAGLVAAGLHPNLVPYADFVTSTTHKTLRGPRGGLILCKEEYAKAVDKAVFPGIQGDPLMHVIAAKAVAFKEALEPEFKQYQEQVVKNAASLAQKLVDSGLELVSGGTDNHLMLVDVLRGYQRYPHRQPCRDHQRIQASRDGTGRRYHPENPFSGISNSKGKTAAGSQRTLR